MIKGAALCKTIDKMVSNCVSEQHKFTARQQRLLEDYNSMPYGDEEDDRSQVITTEVSDNVDANMVSLARIFQGAGDPVEFIPTSQTEEAVKEARQKQAYTSYIIQTVEDSFVTIHGALKSSQIFDYAVLEYDIEDKTESEFHRMEGQDLDQITMLLENFEQKDGIESVSIESKDELDNGLYNVEFRLTRKTKEHCINNISVEDFLITAGVATKGKAELIGKKFTKTRGALIGEGFDKDKVAKLPSDDGESRLDYITFVDQGGKVTEGNEDNMSLWAAEKVSGVDVFVKLYNDKHIEELRHVVKVSDVVLLDEAADHINYAFGSAILMPNNAVGKGAAQASQSPQRVSTVVTRQTLDNLYSVNHPRHIIRYDKDGVGGVSMDDMLDIQLDGIVRTDGDPMRDVAPLVMPFVGDKALMILAYLDGAQSKATGAIQANQALQADNLNEETATRFEGVQNAATGKIELQARVIGETLFTQLYEGIAWQASRYQNKELEIEVLGKPMKIDPTKWRYGHKIRTKIGTGAADNDKTMQSLIGLYQLQKAAIDSGSRLSDESLLYNTLVKITQQSNQNSPQEFFNNPDEPSQVVTAERDILKKMVNQLDQQLKANEPLTMMEQIKAQAKMQGDQLNHDAQMKQLMVKIEQDNQKLQQNMQQFMLEMSQKERKEISDKTYDYTKLELDNSVDIPNAGMENIKNILVSKNQANIASLTNEELLSVFR